MEAELKLGSITEIWRSSSEWLRYCQHLDTMEPEGFDSEGQPMKLVRKRPKFALFPSTHFDAYFRADTQGFSSCTLIYIIEKSTSERKEWIPMPTKNSKKW